VGNKFPTSTSAFFFGWIILTLLGGKVPGLCQQSNRAKVWYFGNYIGLDFNTEPPTLLLDGQIGNNETDSEPTASMCDLDGNLLFYTDGVTVWNREHEVMPGGSDLWSSATATQTLIVPLPENPDIYYVFTTSPGSYDVSFPIEHRGFRYSLVDLSKDNGLGVVVEKNMLLSESTTEKVTATVHANGRDYWVVMHEFNNNIFKAFLVSPQGIDPEPVISKTGGVHSGGFDANDEGNAVGQMKFSADGSRLALAIFAHKTVEVFSFDALRGRLAFESRFADFSEPDRIYGVEFSPSGRFLYATDAGCSIYQFDLADGKLDGFDYKIVSNLEPLCDRPSQLQLGPDNKIYVAKYGISFIGIINNPEVLGEDVDFESHGIEIPSDGLRYCKNGLPNFITSFFYEPANGPRAAFLDYPNVFSPNNDGYNERFDPIIVDNIQYIETTIYNRWGNEVFASDDLTRTWDGGNSPVGTYYWFVRYRGANGRSHTQKGYVNLVR